MRRSDSLLGFNVNVLDIRTILDVTLLVIGSEWVLSILFNKELLPVTLRLNLVDKLTDVFFLDFIHEMNDNSPWHAVVESPVFLGLLIEGNAD